MPLMGNLRQFALPTVLRAVESEQRTGRLRLAYGGQEGAIYFTSGQWALLSRPGGDTPLAEQFLRAGLISPEDFEDATGASVTQVRAMTDSQAVQMLMRAHVLGQDQLRAWAADDAVTMLVTAFTWPDGDFLFEDGAIMPAGRVATILNVSMLIDQAQLRLRESVSRTPPPLSPEMVVDFAEVDPNGDPIRITREHWRLLTYVDGRTSLLGISQRMGEQEIPILRLASQLVANGIILVVGRAS
ncbi:MAG TPA: DUF4388 domain-containing protein [Ktedonobacterales bacterium]|nr:DUF4388 domain-containing protein [Ktedonobacterales bacterium]